MKGNKSAKLQMVYWLLFSAYHLILLHICSKIMKVSLAVQSFKTDTIFILNIPKENNSDKNGGVMVFVLCILSEEALYLFQVS